jgi:hypothetical protein
MTAPGKAPSPSQWAMDAARSLIARDSEDQRDHARVKRLARHLDAARAAGQREAIEQAIAAVKNKAATPPCYICTTCVDDMERAIRALVGATCAVCGLAEAVTLSGSGEGVPVCSEACLHKARALPAAKGEGESNG